MKLIFVALICVAVAAKAHTKKRCYPVTVPEPTIIVDPPPPPVPVCTKKFEAYNECGTACPLECGKPDPLFCTANCVVGCFCQEGYRRDSNGNCVLPIDCPSPTPVCSKKFEEYTDCGTACPLKCGEAPAQFCTLQCVSGCFCQSGYARDSNGDCVLPIDCPSPTPVCSKKFEEYKECGPAAGCVKTCDKPNGGICTKQCVSGCFCQDGYLRDSKGDCVLQKDCPTNSCGKNEEWTDCNQFCGDAVNRCKFLINKVACRPSGCTSGCICKEGFYRDDKENCVAAKDCTGVCEANEVLVACSTLCGEKTCDNDVERYCGLGPCEPKCHCKKGYVRDADGKCIKSSACPSTDPCKLPIVVGPCRGSFPRYGYDSETQQCREFIYGGCEGNSNNFEKLEDCEAKCEKKPVCSKKKHEVYSECGANGCQNTCENPTLSQVCKAMCIAGCVCEDGYIRDSQNNCVLPKNCPSTDPCKLPIVAGSCKAAFPRYGYDSETKQCKLFSYGGCGGNANNFENLKDCEAKCEKKPVCSKKKHEVYSECGANGCQNTCENPTLSQVCRAMCIAGCVCEEGYIRDSQNNCVLPKDCPPVVVAMTT